MMTMIMLIIVELTDNQMLFDQIMLLLAGGLMIMIMMMMMTIMMIMIIMIMIMIMIMMILIDLIDN